MNILNILKNVPKGTILYTTIYGYVTFDYVWTSKYFTPTYPVCCKHKLIIDDYKDCELWLTSEGKYMDIPDAECIIFPSKEQRDWKLFEQELNKKK